VASSKVLVASHGTLLLRDRGRGARKLRSGGESTVHANRFHRMAAPSCEIHGLSDAAAHHHRRTGVDPFVSGRGVIVHGAAALESAIPRGRRAGGRPGQVVYFSRWSELSPRGAKRAMVRL
jgi:hypothetical protein